MVAGISWLAENLSPAPGLQHPNRLLPLSSPLNHAIPRRSSLLLLVNALQE